MKWTLESTSYQNSETNHLNNTLTSKEIEFIRREGKTSNSLYENSMTLIPKPDIHSNQKNKK